MWTAPANDRQVPLNGIRNSRQVLRRLAWRAAVVGLTPVLTITCGDAPTEVRLWGGPGLDVGNSIRPVGSDGFAVVGYTDGPSGSQRDAWFLRLDEHGDTLWTRRYGGELAEHAWDFQVTPAGTFLVAGFKLTSRGDEDVWLLHLDPAGTVLWEATFGGESDERAWAITLLENGNAVILAETTSFGAGAEDVYLICVDETGAALWTEHVGGPGTDRAFSIAAWGEGALFTGMSASGDDGSDLMVGTVSSDGEARIHVSQAGQGDELGHGVVGLPSGRYLVTGYTSSPDGNDVMYVWLDEDLREERRLVVPSDGDNRAMMTAISPNGRLASATYSLLGGDWEIGLLEGSVSAPAQRTWSFLSPGPDRGVSVSATATGDWMLTGTVSEGQDPGQLAIFRITRVGLGR